MAMQYPLYRPSEGITPSSGPPTLRSNSSGNASASSYPPPSNYSPAPSYNPAIPFNPGPGPQGPPPGAAPPAFSASPAPSYGHDSITKRPGGPGAYTFELDRERLGMNRTPSPTPSEAKALSTGLFDWRAWLNWHYWAKKEYIKYYIILAVILTFTALISIYHDDIVKWLTPVTKFLHSFKYGWLVPIGILFVISFPPLFGHEIVAILCGLVWGLWIGFAIVCAGTFLGEVGNFYAFKYCCRARGEKMERTQIPYACLAHCVRTGGFKIALIARFSAIPGHFTTAVFATCGMNIFVFCIAAFLSLPKQFITVYLGVILEESSTGTESTKSKIISDSVLGFTFLVTLVAMWWIFRQMDTAKPTVIYARRKARQGKMQGRVDLYANPALNDSDSSVGAGYNPRSSLSDIPLTATRAEAAVARGPSAHPRYDYEQAQKQKQYEDYLAQRQQHQQWDASGRAVGYTPGPAPQVMYTPQPQTPGRSAIQPGAYAGAMMNNNAPRRAETGDAVGWDAAGNGAVQMRERQLQGQGQGQQQALEPSTPTQAQYSNAPASNQQRPISVLPTPPYHQLTVPQPRSPPPSDRPVSLALPTPPFHQAAALAYQQQQQQQPQQQLSVPSADRPISMALPTPPFHLAYQQQQQTPPQSSSSPPQSPFDDPPTPMQRSGTGLHAPAQHSIEPTGMSYHTAYGGSEGE
ncbi:hypothetical protein HMN09_00807900 [Mycena chlorophos]|uniref:Golgi apparatus membrane protein TVP38 n=1 Tax=Mycena chlorophos TaxID=658473 RepID=A0A8H6SUX2_MYCCL|nr:hypothetical protein HMN09_00807900 [Mycena chlorophos]